jgi:multisubunit Na+/H+ antiporter MnhC subunit
MKQIDFLPEVYRERMKLRRARVWWGLVMLIFGAAIVSTAAAQYWLRSSVEQQYAELESEFIAAQQQVKRLAQLQTDNRSAGQWAGLVTYLEQPWPRSQLLAEVIRPLPDTLLLTELVIGEEETVRQVEEAGPRRRGPRETDTQSAKTPPAQTDLDQIRRTHDLRRVVIEISGTTQDDAPFHEYVTQLGRSPLVAKAQIKSFGRRPGASIQTPKNFTVQIEFRASHGQPDLAPAVGSPDQLAQGGASP